jgi:hypothetical protein
MVRSRVFRGRLVGNVCVSATRWNRVAPVSALVLRRTPGGPHLPPCPLPLPVEERKGEGGTRGEPSLTQPDAQHLAPPARQRERAANGGTERWPPNTMVADARYAPHEKSEFLIKL